MGTNLCRSQLLNFQGYCICCSAIKNLKSKNIYGQLVHKVLNFGMKHDCEIVIIGVAANCKVALISKAMLPKNQRENQKFFLTD